MNSTLPTPSAYNTESEIFHASEIHCTKSNSGVQTTCSENESLLHSECLPDLVHDPELEYLLQN